tara:strand:+ start:911 stop:1849 length:939 start_codon:yes stop_codon:yes gene_type:complete
MLSVNIKKYIYIILFFFVSFSFWILTKLSEDYNSKLTLEIDIINAPDDYIVKKQNINSILVFIKASGFELFYNKLFQNKLIVDLEEEKIVDDKIVIDYNENKFKLKETLNSNIDISSVFPDQIVIELEEVVNKFVPIVLENELKIKSGYGLRSPVDLSPDSIQVSGPLKEISKISYVSALIDADLNIENDYTADYEIVRDKKISYEFSSGKAVIYVDRYSEKTIKIPILVRGIPDSLDLRLYPNEVDISFQSSIKRLKNISEKDFIVSVSFDSKTKKLSKDLDVSIDSFPSSLKNLKISHKKVEFLIKNKKL